MSKTRKSAEKRNSHTPVHINFFLQKPGGPRTFPVPSHHKIPRTKQWAAKQQPKLWARARQTTQGIYPSLVYKVTKWNPSSIINFLDSTKAWFSINWQYLQHKGTWTLVCIHLHVQIKIKLSSISQKMSSKLLCHTSLCQRRLTLFY